MYTQSIGSCLAQEYQQELATLTAYVRAVMLLDAGFQLSCIKNENYVQRGLADDAARALGDIDNVCAVCGLRTGENVPVRRTTGARIASVLS